MLHVGVQDRAFKLYPVETTIFLEITATVRTSVGCQKDVRYGELR